jgi:hypothetical protein
MTIYFFILPIIILGLAAFAFVAAGAFRPGTAHLV